MLVTRKSSRRHNQRTQISHPNDHPVATAVSQTPSQRSDRLYCQNPRLSRKRNIGHSPVWLSVEVHRVESLRLPLVRSVRSPLPLSGCNVEGRHLRGTVSKVRSNVSHRVGTFSCRVLSCDISLHKLIASCSKAWKYHTLCWHILMPSTFA